MSTRVGRVGLNLDCGNFSISISHGEIQQIAIKPTLLTLLARQDFNNPTACDVKEFGMTSYAEKLLAEAASRRRSSQAKTASPVQRSLQHIPLDMQVRQMMLTIPKGDLGRPWHMDEFVSRLEGKYRERPHPRWVGKALREIGWSQQRLWSSEWGGRRVWIAPQQTTFN